MSECCEGCRTGTSDCDVNPLRSVTPVTKQATKQVKGIGRGLRWSAVLGGAPERTYRAALAQVQRAERRRVVAARAFAKALAESSSVPPLEG